MKKSRVIISISILFLIVLIPSWYLSNKNDTVELDELTKISNGLTDEEKMITRYDLDISVLKDRIFKRNMNSIT